MTWDLTKIPNSVIGKVVRNENGLRNDLINALRAAQRSQNPAQVLESRVNKMLDEGKLSKSEHSAVTRAGIVELTPNAALVALAAVETADDINAA